MNGFGTSGRAPGPPRFREAVTFGVLSDSLFFSTFAACALSHFLRADPPGRVLFVSLLLFMFLLSSCIPALPSAEADGCRSVEVGWMRHVTMWAPQVFNMIPSWFNMNRAWV